MSTAFDAASVILPQGGGYKAGKLYGWRPDVKQLQDIDVVRAAATDVASRVNSSGVREFVGANVPRWDWSEGGSCPSLLSEPQRTNLFDQDLAGSGVATQVVTVVNGTQYTVSVEGSGSIALTGAGTGTVTEGSPVTFTAGSTSLTCTLTGSLDYAQVEAGAFATSIIYTSGSTATRNADVISKTGIASLIGQSEGTIYLEWLGFNTGSPEQISIDDGSSANRVSVVMGTANDVGLIARASGNITAVVFDSPFLRNVYYLSAIRYATNNFAVYNNGSSYGTDTDGATYPDSTLNRINLSSFKGRIRALAWSKTAFTDSELEALTTP